MDGWLCVDCVASIEHPAMFVDGIDLHGNDRRATDVATVIRADMTGLTDPQGNTVTLTACTIVAGDSLCAPHAVMRLAQRPAVPRWGGR